MTVGLALLLTAAAAAPIADIPFDDDYGLVVLEVSIQGEPLSFLLDTGFDVSILDTGVAERLGLEVLETRNEAQPGGSVEMSSLSPVRLFIGDLEVEDVGFQTAPIAGLGAFIGRDFHGILGHDVLERYVVDIDFPADRLQFHDAEGWDHAGPGQILPVTIRNGEVFAVAGVVMPWGRTVFGSFKIDTGSVDVAGLNLNFVRDSGLIGEETRELKTGGVAVGGETEGRLFRAEAFIFGEHRIRGPIIGYTVDSGGFENRDNAGTLGGGVLARYRLILDYPRNRIILEDGPGVDLEASHDMSGMLIVSPPPDFDALVVAQVAPDSPASEAGLAPGDAIISAGGRSDWKLKEIRHAFEQPGSLEMTIRRDEEDRQVTLQRRPLLPLN